MPPIRIDALLYVVEAKQDVDQRCFACPGVADDCDGFAW